MLRPRQRLGLRVWNDLGLDSAENARIPRSGVRDMRDARTHDQQESSRVFFLAARQVMGRTRPVTCRAERAA